jgi:hypothetical protein
MSKYVVSVTALIIGSACIQTSMTIHPGLGPAAAGAVVHAPQAAAQLTIEPECWKVLGDEGTVALAFSPKGDVLAAVNAQGINFWDVTAGKIA